MRSRGGGGGGQHGCGDMYVFGHVERRNCGERMLRLELLEKRKNKEEAGGGGEGGDLKDAEESSDVLWRPLKEFSDLESDSSELHAVQIITVMTFKCSVPVCVPIYMYDLKKVMKRSILSSISVKLKVNCCVESLHSD